MAKYPVHLELSDRRVVVIGNTPSALKSIHVFSSHNARVVALAESIDTVFEYQCNNSNIELILSAYSKQYLAEATLAVAATKSEQINERIYKDCQELEVLCCIHDKPESSDFIMPSVLHRGSLKVSIATDTGCSAYTNHIARKLEDIFDKRHGEFLAELESARKHLIAEIPNPAYRRSVLGHLVGDESFDYFVKQGPEAWRSRTRELFSHMIR